MLLLLWAGLAPFLTHGQGSHVLKIEMRQNLLVHQVNDLVGAAVLDFPVVADDLQHFFSNPLHQHIRRLLSESGRSNESGNQQGK